MTQNIKNNMSSSCLTRRSGNKEFMCLMDPRVKPEDDRRGVRPRVGDDRRAESGRSMTEMLGVLAVIGVLSVGSIAGYRYAMDNYYTNEILAGASQRAVLVAAQISAGQTPSLAEFRKMNDTAGGTFDSTVTEWVGEFGIKVRKVKESVCENLVKATEDTDIILVKTDDSDLTESDCSGDNNTFLFVYRNDMGGEDIKLDESALWCYGPDIEKDCYCKYGGTYPKCHAKPACIDNESCWCDGFGQCSCYFSGRYPNCLDKPACINDGSCECTSNNCYCHYDGTYPNCYARPDCLDDDSCRCENGSCSCTYREATYPNCFLPACVNDGTCVCNAFYRTCNCIYAGSVPNCYKPDCLNDGTCECHTFDGLIWDCYCTNGGTYPNNCNA